MSCRAMSSDTPAPEWRGLLAAHIISLTMVMSTCVPLCSSALAHEVADTGIRSASSIADRIAFDPPAGAVLPSDALFTDEHGAIVHLTDYVHDAPALVVPAYYSCANLCSVVLEGLAQGLASARLHAGRDLQVIVFSIDPADTPALALQKKHEVLGDLASIDAAGWHFLSGREPAIQAATRALGYRYAYDVEQKEYAHAAGVVVVSRDARVVQTLPGAQFLPAQLHASLGLAGDSEAGLGTIGAAPATQDFARKWLLCFHYDPHSGRYSFAAMNAVRCAGLLALFGLCAYVIRARVREHRSSQR